MHRNAGKEQTGKEAGIPLRREIGLLEEPKKDPKAIVRTISDRVQEEYRPTNALIAHQHTGKRIEQGREKGAGKHRAKQMELLFVRVAAVDQADHQDELE